MTEASRTDGYAHVFADHLTNEFLEPDRRTPAEPLMRLAGVAAKRFHFGRTEIARIDLDQNLARLRILADLVDAAAAPGNRAADMGKSMLDEFAHRMRLARRQYEIVG